MDSKLFREMQQKLLTEAACAVVKVIAAFYPNCDFTVRVRDGKAAGTDLRVNANVTQT